MVLQIHDKKKKSNLTIYKQETYWINILARTALKYLLNYAIYGSWVQYSLNVNFITTLLWAFYHKKIGCQMLSFLKLVLEPTFFLNFSEAHSSRTFSNRRDCFSFVCSAYLFAASKQMATIRERVQSHCTEAPTK